MSRLRTLLEWTVIIVMFVIIGFLVFSFFQGTSSHNGQPSGLPDGYGGFIKIRSPRHRSSQKTRVTGILPSSHLTVIPLPAR